MGPDNSLSVIISLADGIITPRGHVYDMAENAPPLGLSEDEAYTPSLETRLLVLTGTGLALVVGLVVALQGLYLFIYEDARATWEFWGDTDVLGALFVVSALALFGGAILAVLHNDNCLVLIFLGVLVLEVTMLLAVIKVPDGDMRLLLFLLMLLPFATFLVFQHDGVRKWIGTPPQRDRGV